MSVRPEAALPHATPNFAPAIMPKPPDAEVDPKNIPAPTVQSTSPQTPALVLLSTTFNFCNVNLFLF